MISHLVSMEIRTATTSDLELLVPVFEAYRAFYRQPAREADARNYLSDRLTHNESIILLAIDESNVIGFTQLFPTYSSSTLERFYILNDLFVDPQYRSKGIGAILLNAAKKLVIEKGYKGLSLETENNNPAQHLYEKEGWTKDLDFLHYFWANNQKPT
jgi:GNAT superfamily N-acetyltransferase